MLTTIMTVDGRDLALDPDQDIGAIRGASVAAVRAGGDFVDLVLLRGRVVSVLIGPGTGVMIEQHDVHPAPAPDEPWPADVASWDL
jgi:hypothetical protein